MLVIGRKDGESVFFTSPDGQSVRLKIRLSDGLMSVFQGSRKMFVLEFQDDGVEFTLLGERIQIILSRWQGDHSVAMGIEAPRSIKISRDNHVPA